jgi:hypothetical protein
VGDNITTPPVEHWFDSSDLMIENYSKIDCNVHKNVPTKSKTTDMNRNMAEIGNIVTVLNEKLSIDCTRLLKKGDMAIQKAKIDL